VKVAELVDLWQVEVAEANSPGEAVCQTNNICTKAVAEVETTILVAVAIIAKVEDQQLTLQTTISIMIQALAVPIEAMKVLVSTIITITIKVVDLHRNGD
jgi:hypothetical protein